MARWTPFAPALLQRWMSRRFISGPCISWCWIPTLVFFGWALGPPSAGQDGGTGRRPERPRVAPDATGRPEATSAPGPWDNDVIVYRVPAGGEVQKVAVFERSGVPTLARLKDARVIAAHQCFPEKDRASFDKVAVRFSSDDGRTWSGPQVIRLAGLPDGMRFPFDPTLVPLPDGRVRLYFTSTRGRTFEEGSPAIYSAISSDGLEYTFEPGVRFGIEGRLVIDCAVALHCGVFHLFAPDNGPAPRARAAPEARRAQGKQDVPMAPSPGLERQEKPMRSREGVGYHAVSKDGLEFSRVEDVVIQGRRRWLGNAQSDGTRITFYGTGEAPRIGEVPGTGPGGPPGERGGKRAGEGAGEPAGERPGETGRGPPAQTRGRPPGGFWMATSENGESWTLVESPAIPGADPGAVTLPDGTLIVAATGEPRPGTPSARRALAPRRGGPNQDGPRASAKESGPKQDG